MIPKQESLRLRLRKLLKTINPEVLRLIDAGEPQIQVMIAVPNELALHQISIETGFEELLRVSSTGASIIASSGSRIGGHLNDVLDGMDMSGFLLEPTSALVESLPLNKEVDRESRIVEEDNPLNHLYHALEELADELGEVSTNEAELRSVLGDVAANWDILGMMIRLKEQGYFSGNPFIESGMNSRFVVTLHI